MDVKLIVIVFCILLILLAFVHSIMAKFEKFGCGYGQASIKSENEEYCFDKGDHDVSMKFVGTTTCKVESTHHVKGYGLPGQKDMLWWYQPNDKPQTVNCRDMQSIRVQ